MLIQEQLRIEALKLALDLHRGAMDERMIVKAAAMFLKFLNGEADGVEVNDALERG